MANWFWELEVEDQVGSAGREGNVHGEGHWFPESRYPVSRPDVKLVNNASYMRRTLGARLEQRAGAAADTQVASGTRGRRAEPAGEGIEVMNVAWTQEWLKPYGEQESNPGAHPGAGGDIAPTAVLGSCPASAGARGLAEHREEEKRCSASWCPSSHRCWFSLTSEDHFPQRSHLQQREPAAGSWGEQERLNPDCPCQALGCCSPEPGSGNVAFSKVRSDASKVPELRELHACCRVPTGGSQALILQVCDLMPLCPPGLSREQTGLV
ncbi:uncharacterized protein LOC128854448 [Cuculus canorus]|uniref:uncharacterized protein LOC128854448 n=1 Tax=Cuculus canorus TaxID=55661 RepID=UPI0023AAE225|nr:uncharacterized protein LOC128854448 [Cuculus canorus]